MGVVAHTILLSLTIFAGCGEEADVGDNHVLLYRQKELDFLREHGCISIDRGEGPRHGCSMCREARCVSNEWCAGPNRRQARVNVNVRKREGALARHSLVDNAEERGV